MSTRLEGARGAAARHSGSDGGGGTMHASTRPGSRWRTGRCVHGQSPVWDAALQRPVIAETARESCFAQNKGAPVEYSTRRITTRTAGAPTHCRCRCRKQRAHVRHASTRCPLLAESARVGGRSTVSAKDFVPKGQREVLHGVSCSIRDDSTASWTTREHLCDTVREGGEDEGALEARSTEQKRELRRENRWQADNARLRETAGDETLDV